MMAAVDWISTLPEETKVIILSGLLIIEAVRTSILSRSWCHIWSLLSGFKLDLDMADGPDYPNDIFLPEIIVHLLSSLRGLFKHYSLGCFDLFGISAPHIKNFVDLISQRGDPFMFSIRLVCRPMQLHLPYFCSLKYIQLHRVIFACPVISAALSTSQPCSCSMFASHNRILCYLSTGQRSIFFPLTVLFYFQQMERLESLSVTFNSPLLEDIRFNFWKSMAEARVVSAPCLERASITARIEEPPPAEESAWVAAATLGFMGDVAHVAYLSLCSDVLQSLSRVNVPQTLRVPFH